MRRFARTHAQHILTGATGTLLTSALFVVTTSVRAQQTQPVDAKVQAPSTNVSASTPIDKVTSSASKASDNSGDSSGNSPSMPTLPIPPTSRTTEIKQETSQSAALFSPSSQYRTQQSLPGSVMDRSRSNYNWLNDGLITGQASRALWSSAYSIGPGKNNLLRLPSVAGKQDKDKSAAQSTPAQTTPPADSGPPSRALPSPIENPPFPFTDWTTNSGFPIGESWDVAPGTLQHALFGTKLDNTKFRFGGWMDAGIVVSNARDSNLPDTYNLIPKKPELDQLVLVAQKMVDTTQTRYVDWGFYSAHLFGIDYRFTSATGYFSEQLTKHNNLYGYDPVLQWGEVYLPKVADGTVIQFGRYISPIDIEAQLSNSNYLYSHSLMFGVDPYTYTGINAQVRVNKEFMYMIGVHAGNENSPWSGRANLNGEFLIGWSSADNKDSLWGGLDSISGSGKTVRGHDDEQIVNFVWGHVWNKRLHMQTQGYYMWQYDALVGGTPITGPSEPYAGSGVGAKIPGKAYAVGFVNNLEYKVNKSDYISFRSGYLNDAQGWRTGVATHYSDFTLGYSHLFARNFWIRPEVRYDHSYDAAAFDNGTKRDLLSVAGDIIMRF